MINLIKFNKKYYKPIINGQKTQTIRNKNKRLKKDEIIKAIFPGTTHECYLKITETGYKQFQYLTDEDAKREGYNTLKELKNDLLNIYPLLDDFDRLWYYQFIIIIDDKNAA